MPYFSLLQFNPTDLHYPTNRETRKSLTALSFVVLLPLFQSTLGFSFYVYSYSPPPPTPLAPQLKWYHLSSTPNSNLGWWSTPKLCRSALNFFLLFSRLSVLCTLAFVFASLYTLDGSSPDLFIFARWTGIDGFHGFLESRGLGCTLGFE